MGQMALLIKKTSQQHFQNRLQTDSKGQTCSHTTQKQHSLQMCTNKTRSLAPQPPNTTVLWPSSEVPPIPPPRTTAAQCFVKPSWADHTLLCPRSGQGTHGPSLFSSRPHCWVHRPGGSWKRLTTLFSGVLKKAVAMELYSPSAQKS